MDDFITWSIGMDDVHYLGCLDGQPSLLGILGWTTFIAWITRMDDLHCLDYLDGGPSLLGLV
eukprot:1497048-Karenia_brevis.AAC.1